MPDTVTMVLDMDTGSLGFSVAGQWLGWAATGLSRTTPLYPMASTVWGHCEVGIHNELFLLTFFNFYPFSQVKLKYLHGLEAGVLSLQDIARTVIRDAVATTARGEARDNEKMETSIDTLPLPGAVKKFVKFQ